MSPATSPRRRRRPATCRCIAVSARDEASGWRASSPISRPGGRWRCSGRRAWGSRRIVNRLVGRELLPTGEVRDWDARGRHTSVHRQLVVREAGGLIIDTPGMRELQLWDTDARRRHVRATSPTLGARLPLPRLPARPRAWLRGQGRRRGRARSTPAATRATSSSRRSSSRRRPGKRSGRNWPSSVRRR